MSAPLWRVFVDTSGSVYYGDDDGHSGTDDYGSEAVVRKAAEYWKKEGLYTRLEHRESPSEPWVEVTDKLAEPK